MATTFLNPRHPYLATCTRMVFALAASLFWSAAAHGGSFAGGTGEANDPYQVATPEQLIAIGEDASLGSKHFILTSDIDLSGFLFSQAIIPSLSGGLHGNSHTIQGMTIQGADKLGLIGTLLEGGLVDNLTLQAIDVAGGKYVGGLIGYSSGHAVDCHSTGRIHATGDHIGGLIGHSLGLITDCSSACDVDGAVYVGGLAGGAGKRLVGNLEDA